MLIELSIIPLGNDGHSSGEIAEALKAVENSGLPYQFTPSATCIEGEWDEVLPLIKECHELARRSSNHVITMIKVEDVAGAGNQLVRNVRSVEEKVGHPLRKGTSEAGHSEPDLDNQANDEIGRTPGSAEGDLELIEKDLAETYGGRRGGR